MAKSLRTMSTKSTMETKKHRRRRRVLDLNHRVLCFCLAVADELDSQQSDAYHASAASKTYPLPNRKRVWAWLDDAHSWWPGATDTGRAGVLIQIWENLLRQLTAGVEIGPSANRLIFFCDQDRKPTVPQIGNAVGSAMTRGSSGIKETQEELLKNEVGAYLISRELCANDRLMEHARQRGEYGLAIEEGMAAVRKSRLSADDAVDRLRRLHTDVTQGTNRLQAATTLQYILGSLEGEEFGSIDLKREVATRISGLRRMLQAELHFHKAGIDQNVGFNVVERVLPSGTRSKTAQYRVQSITGSRTTLYSGRAFPRLTLHLKFVDPSKPDFGELKPPKRPAPEADPSSKSDMVRPHALTDKCDFEQEARRLAGEIRLLGHAIHDADFDEADKRRMSRLVKSILSDALNSSAALSRPRHPTIEK